jgi:hypothetical protein
VDNFFQNKHKKKKSLVPAVITTVGDSFYKISSEALLVLQILVKVLPFINKNIGLFETLVDIFTTILIYTIIYIEI